VRRLIVALIVTLSCATATHAEIKWEVVRVLPHDTKAFTQGLTVKGDHIYETTGQIGASELRIIRLSDGKILRRQPMRSDVFGEGSTLWDDKVISLTWRHETGFVWRRRDLKQISSFSYPGEGWGLTQDGTSLIMSDGTAQLRFLDPESFKEKHRVTVSWQSEPVRFLNELEYVDGAVYANIWYSPLIAKIDPESGEVSDFINLQPLVAENAASKEGVLNGIAWDTKAKLLYVTGKNWPRIYAIRLLD
jgi:glutamine cyclotransferase